MHHLIYMSTAVQPLSDAELGALLNQARLRNEQDNITGALVYGDGRFMQIVEGDKAALDDLYTRLLSDKRHVGLVKLADKEVAERSFTDWSMAFRPVSDEEFLTMAGYVQPIQLNLQPLNLSAADSLLLHMMRSFIMQPPTE
ncbi:MULTISPECIES: BLUF domain-containing protein [Hymenobacter]|uniref:BLUF domain-containing protein n=2 Tax=Hymenobacter TaxID=89966 RepID=A0ABS6X1J1_9BACT|nr:MULTISPECIES: BLUF domain-containing protein [Hymenobacter]MBO3271794.1 BLUF domain-containing protein [Hymenobacter defluvii]MBW3129706.1 BLUF domain-containing protein [Hymenobacter profundi]QNE38656.1 BLUF domain-containing protein [Hymenobacter sp. NBH84]